MIGMTEKARKKMRSLTAGAGAVGGVRIDVARSGCRYAYRFATVAAPMEGDFLLEADGIRLYFAPAGASALFNVEIDHNGAPDESGFTVKRLAPCG